MSFKPESNAFSMPTHGGVRVLQSCWLAHPSGPPASRTKMTPSGVTFDLPSRHYPLQTHWESLPKQHYLCGSWLSPPKVSTSCSSVFSERTFHSTDTSSAGGQIPWAPLGSASTLQSRFNLPAQLARPETLAPDLMLLSAAHIQSVFNYLRNRTTCTIVSPGTRNIWEYFL